MFSIQAEVHSESCKACDFKYLLEGIEQGVVNQCFQSRQAFVMHKKLPWFKLLINH